MLGRTTYFILIAGLVIFASACSGNADNPLVPGSSLNHTPGTTLDSDNRGLWGYWDVSINTDTHAVEINPLRGVNFTANINSLLEGTPGNLIIEDMDLTNFGTEGIIECTITLKHPFTGLDQFHGFDVWGVFMHNGSAALEYDDLIYSDGTGNNEAMLLNPDGFTRWFNYDEFNDAGAPIFTYFPGALSNLPNPSATLNPFKIFATGLSATKDYYEWITTSPKANDRGIFLAGGISSRKYQLQFPFDGGSPIVEFQYAVIASWEMGDPTLTGDPTMYDPMDFPAEANCEEAFFLHVSTDDSDMFNDGTGNLGGSFRADIEVFDWQGGIVSKTGVVNEIESIIVEGDFIPGGSYQLNQTELSAIAYPGTDNSSVFQVEIIDCTPQESGETGFWLIVEAAGEFGDSYDQGYSTPYPYGARRSAFLPGIVIVVEEPPNIIFVDDSNTSSTENGSMSFPYNTIQEGIDAAPDEYEVWVDDSGSPYAEEVMMKTGAVVKSVNWDDSDGSNRAVIDPPNIDNTWPVYFDNVDNAHLEGFAIGFTAYNNLSSRTVMLYVESSDNCSIVDCLFTGNTNCYAVIAVYAEDSGNLTISNCRFDGIDKDTDNMGCVMWSLIFVWDCPEIVIENNIFTDIRSSDDSVGKTFKFGDINSTSGITFRNNLLHHIEPHAQGMDVLMGHGFYFNNCSDIEVVNNTVDYVDITDAFFIQQFFAYWFEACSSVTFDNNIITRIYSVGFPPVLGRGVDAHNGEWVTLDYTDIFDTVVAHMGDVYEGTGYIEVDPQYNDPDNEDYDISPTSPAQAGDPSITDWDDDGSGGSRMGCHGGPGGEFVGLLTP